MARYLHPRRLSRAQLMGLVLALALPLGSPLQPVQAVPVLSDLSSNDDWLSAAEPVTAGSAGGLGLGLLANPFLFLGLSLLSLAVAQPGAPETFDHDWNPPVAPAEGPSLAVGFSAMANGWPLLGDMAPSLPFGGNAADNITRTGLFTAPVLTFLPGLTDYSVLWNPNFGMSYLGGIGSMGAYFGSSSVQVIFGPDSLTTLSLAATPGPLPITGALAAWLSARRLRRRRKRCDPAASLSASHQP